MGTYEESVYSARNGRDTKVDSRRPRSQTAGAARPWDGNLYVVLNLCSDGNKRIVALFGAPPS